MPYLPPYTAGTSSLDGTFAANVAIAFLFWVVSCLHIRLMVKFRSYYMTPLVVASVLLAFGFVMRLVDVLHPDAAWTWMCSQIGIFAASPLISILHFLIFSRIVHHLEASQNPLNHSTFGIIYQASGVISLLSQATGAALFSSTSVKNGVSLQSVGQKLLFAGLFLQMILALSMLFSAACFQMNMHDSQGHEAVETEKTWVKEHRGVWIGLWGGVVFNIVRTCFEFSEMGMFITFFSHQNPREYLRITQWDCLAFDAIAMILVLVFTAIFYPAYYLPNDTRVTVREVLDYVDPDDEVEGGFFGNTSIGRNNEEGRWNRIVDSCQP